MWVKLDEKHKNGDTWLARNKYEKTAFKVVYQLVDEECPLKIFVLKDHPHVFVSVHEVWEGE